MLLNQTRRDETIQRFSISADFTPELWGCRLAFSGLSGALADLAGNVSDDAALNSIGNSCDPAFDRLGGQSNVAGCRAQILDSRLG